MPKGHHYGRKQIRAYTSEYHRINANIFKSLLTASLGNYTLDNKSLGSEHRDLVLSERGDGSRYITFTINSKPHLIALKLDSRSISNKLYLACPYCQKSRQSLYAIKYAYVCRQCIGLEYASQSERPKERLMRRIRKLRKELWGYDWPEVNNMFEQVTYWPKPKWMRWITFEKKREKIIELENKYWPMSVEHIEKLFSSLLVTEHR
ncbi:MAG: hypothetical protein AXW17_05710 [Colwellia sp. Phe_37]|nr:MAG: hypothetical protein AXW17_05710 [Colwellia sp. Phe_37]